MIRVDANDRIFPVNKLTTIMGALAEEGVPMREALEGLRLTATALHSHTTLVSLNQVLQGCRNAARLSPDPHFAYRTGRRFHFSAFGMYGFAILSCTTFREMMDIASRYYQLSTPLLDMSFHEENGTGVWSLAPYAHFAVEPALFRFIIELDLGILISLHRDVMGESFAPRQIQLGFGAPRDAAVYPELFDCPVVFNRPHSMMIFDAAWLDGDPRMGHEISKQETLKLCDELMEQLALRVGISGKVRELLIMRRAWDMNIDSVARHLHLSERTLRRKLREEKTSFRQLVAEIRMDLTIRYLRDTELSVQEIAHALGFSEDASFRQALRRWAGASPLEMRGRLRKQTGEGLEGRAVLYRRSPRVAPFILARSGRN
jgi:AraC-like DNA-binding protein